LSMFGSWRRPKVAPSIAAVLRGLKDPSGIEARRALYGVVRESGPAYFDFLNVPPPYFEDFRGAEFLEVGEKLYLILFAQSGTGPIPGSTGLLVILLSADGRALDFVDVSCSIWEGALWPSVLTEERQIAIHRSKPGEREGSYQ